MGLRRLWGGEETLKEEKGNWNKKDEGSRAMGISDKFNQTGLERHMNSLQR